jgi:hypothetical protein
MSGRFLFNISQTFQKIFEKIPSIEYGHKSNVKEITMMSNEELKMKAESHDVSDAGAEVVTEAVEVAAEGVVSGYKKIEDGVVTGYKKIEDGVVSGYKKIENGVVTGFGKLVDKCVQLLFARKGETVEEAKARLSGKGKK